MSEESSVDAREFNHYYKDVTHLQYVDVYRVLSLFEVHDPCVAHAIKKLLVPGRRGSKNRIQDIREAVFSLQRALEIEEENSKAL